MKSFPVERKDSFVLQSQCYGCLYSEDAKNQSINIQEIDLIFVEYSGLNTWKVNVSTGDGLTMMILWTSHCMHAVVYMMSFFYHIIVSCGSRDSFIHFVEDRFIITN